jgi:hypothetical protein
MEQGKRWSSQWAWVLGLLVALPAERGLREVAQLASQGLTEARLAADLASATALVARARAAGASAPAGGEGTG